MKTPLPLRRSVPKEPTRALENHLEATLTLLEQCPTRFQEREKRAYYSIGVIASLLDGLAGSSGLTVEQRQLVKRVRVTWNNALHAPREQEQPSQKGE